MHSSYLTQHLVFIYLKRPEKQNKLLAEVFAMSDMTSIVNQTKPIIKPKSMRQSKTLR